MAVYFCRHTLQNMRAKKKATVVTFADTLLRGMADVGFTDETLSEVIEYNPDTIYRWRTGKLRAAKRAQKACIQAIAERRK